MSSDTSYQNVQELTALVQSQKPKFDPSQHFIDQIIPQDIVHQYSPQDVLSAAFTSGCLITRCCHDHNQYKANGVWLEAPPELAPQLKEYPNLSEGYCPACSENLKAEIHHFRYLRQRLMAEG